VLKHNIFRYHRIILERDGCHGNLLSTDRRLQAFTVLRDGPTMWRADAAARDGVIALQSRGRVKFCEYSAKWGSFRSRAER
jgi:hypothetical protein